MTPRVEYLSQRFNEFLDRFSPPRSIQNNPLAMQQDADAMLKIILARAPADGYSEWLDHVLEAVIEGMTTRSWPAPGELVKACNRCHTERAQGDGIAESAAVLRMAEWFSKFGRQMPGHGNAKRTAALIAQGVLANEREARFRGFDLDRDQMATAMNQRMGKDEWRHHVDVMARLWEVDAITAEARIRAEHAAGAAPQEASIPDKSMFRGGQLVDGAA